MTAAPLWVCRCSLPVHVSPRSCSRAIATARSGEIVSTSPSGSFFSFFMRAGALSIVKLLISSVPLISAYPLPRFPASLLPTHSPGFLSSRKCKKTG